MDLNSPASAVQSPEAIDIVDGYLISCGAVQRGASSTITAKRLPGSSPISLAITGNFCSVWTGNFP